MGEDHPDRYRDREADEQDRGDQEHAAERDQQISGSQSGPPSKTGRLPANAQGASYSWQQCVIKRQRERRGQGIPAELAVRR